VVTLNGFNAGEAAYLCGPTHRSQPEERIPGGRTWFPKTDARGSSRRWRSTGQGASGVRAIHGSGRLSPMPQGTLANRRLETTSPLVIIGACCSLRAIVLIPLVIMVLSTRRIQSIPLDFSIPLSSLAPGTAASGGPRSDTLGSGKPAPDASNVSAQGSSPVHCPADKCRKVRRSW